MRTSHIQSVKAQEDRITKLRCQHDDGLLRTEKLRQELSGLQQRMFELEGTLKTAQEQKNRLRDLGGDENKIKSYEQQIETLETEGLSLLEAIEGAEEAFNDARGFTAGLEKTISEIAQEVNEINQKENQEIKNLDLRLSLIEEELPPNFREILKKTLLKNLAMGPFTRVESGSCYMCRYKISRIDESEIDMQKKLKVCPQCSRIFLPYGT